MLSTYVIVLIVLMALCAVVGAIYAYLYFTRINPACKGHRDMSCATGSAGLGAGSGGDPHGRQIATVSGDLHGRRMGSMSVDDDQPAAPSTHMFLFRKT